ncbi:MAG: hypothetical protein HQK49_08770 [Oligoflexia bacterium]|nr:hypothetical protein [Oligoflexia bacterium]
MINYKRIFNLKQFNLNSDFSVWLLVFVYSSILIFSFQKILLPFFFPSIQLDDIGIIKGTDSAGFYQVAIECANLIKQGALSKEIIIYNINRGFGISLIYGLMFAVVKQSPIYALPLSASLHASGCLFLYKMLNMVLNDRRKSFYGIIPFAIYPTAAFWYTQFLKDTVIVPAIILYIYSLIFFTNYKKLNKKNFFLAVLLLLTSTTLILVVRVYLIDVLKIFLLITLIFSIKVCIFLYRRRDINFYGVLSSVVFLALFLFLILPWEKNLLTQNSVPTQLPDSNSVQLPEKDSVQLPEKDSVQLPEKDSVQLADSNSVQLSKKYLAQLDAQIILNKANHQNNNLISYLQISYLMTKRFVAKVGEVIKVVDEKIKNLFVDRIIEEIAFRRNGFINTPGATSIDADVRFKTIGDIINYIPRASLLAFTAPFPSILLEQGSSKLMNLSRRMVFFEMIFIYVFLLMVPYVLWKHKANAQMWLIICFCFTIMLSYTLIVTNIGTLHRFRYPFIMIISGLGVGGWFSVFNNFKKR